MVTDQIILDYFIKSNGHINVQRLTNISEEYKEYLDNRYTGSQSLRETIKRIQYNIIYTWTILDLKKRNIAQQNNLNYIEFWNINEVKEWINKK